MTTHDQAESVTQAAQTREENDVTVYSAGGRDLFSHRKGEAVYTCHLDVPAQGLYAGRKYELSPPDLEESLGLVAKNLAASLPKEPAK